MKKRALSLLLALVMVAALVPMAAYAEEPEVAITNANFPDDAFRNYIVTPFDSDGNGSLSQAERDAVTEINVDGFGVIGDLTGIAYFPNLQALYCSYNQLTALDISGNPALTSLECGNNQLTTLDLSKNTVLTELICFGNQLTALDLSNNTKLYYLDCSGNRLTALDLSGNTALTSLECSINQLTALDLSGNPALEDLHCANNQLTALDLSKNTALTYLNCCSNQLTALDLSGNPALTDSDCFCVSNYYSIQITPNRTFDLSALPGFDVRKASQWIGGTVSGNILTVDKDAEEVTYVYDCGKEISTVFTLVVTGVSDDPLAPTDPTKPSEPTAPAEGVAVDSAHFPDKTFRNYVAFDLDSDGNGVLSQEELDTVTEISVPEFGIGDLTGIAYFKNLTSLNCWGNQLTALDLSDNPALTHLDCCNSQLTTLDLSKNTALTYLDCEGNQLITLNLSNNTELHDLDCSDNQLTTLDLSNNTALYYLDCASNRLTALDLSNNTALTYLDCTGNRLTALDLGNNTEMAQLYCSGNQLTAMDLSKLVKLGVTDASDNQYAIELCKGRTFDLSALPGFDVRKASQWVGGTVSGNTLTVDKDAEEVTYVYDCGNRVSKTFTLVVTGVSDDPISPADPPKPTEPSNPAKPGASSAPDTGDSSHMALWISLIVTACAGIFLAAVRPFHKGKYQGN